MTIRSSKLERIEEGRLVEGQVQHPDSTERKPRHSI